MFQTLRLVLLFIYVNLIYSSPYCDDTNAPYIIYTIQDFSVPAENIKKLHGEDVPSNCQLNTIIKYKENFNEQDFIDFLNTFNDNTKYLLIIGDENIIPPISISDNCNVVEITDDKFHEDFIIGQQVLRLFLSELEGDFYLN